MSYQARGKRGSGEQSWCEVLSSLSSLEKPPNGESGTGCVWKWIAGAEQVFEHVLWIQFEDDLYTCSEWLQGWQDDSAPLFSIHFPPCFCDLWSIRWRWKKLFEPQVFALAFSECWSNDLWHHKSISKCWKPHQLNLQLYKTWGGASLDFYMVYIHTCRFLIYIEIRVLLAGQKNMCVSKPMFGICVLLSKMSSGNLPSEQSCQFMALTSTCQAKRSFLCQVLRHEWALPDVPCSSTWSPKWYALSDQKIEMQNCTMPRVKFRLVWARQNPHRAVRHDKWTGSSRFKWKDVKHDYPHHMAAVTSRGRPPAWAAILSKSLVTQNPSDLWIWCVLGPLYGRATKTIANGKAAKKMDIWIYRYTYWYNGCGSEWEKRTKKGRRFNMVWSFSALTSSILRSKTKPPLHINGIYSTFINPQRPQRGGKEVLLFTIKAEEPNGAAAANGEGEYHPAGRTFEMIFHGPNHESPTCRLEIPNISLRSESGTFGICTRFHNSFVSLEGGPAPETEFFCSFG